MHEYPFRVKDDLWRAVPGGVEVDASSRLAMVGACTQYCSDDMEYTWGMYRLGLHGSWLVIEPDELVGYTSGTPLLTHTHTRGLPA